MDILASIFAYLGCVTGIVSALAISFFVFVAAPDRPAAPAHAVAMVAKPNLPKTAVATPVVTAAAVEQPAPKHADNATVAGVVMNDAAWPPAATAVRPKTRMSRTQLSHGQRSLVQEERARRWAYQSDPDFEARFLGYAD
jgi:hypothetical protein